MYLLGIDLGSSFIKGSLMDSQNQVCIARESMPGQEMTMISHQNGWAEQDPELWWTYIKELIKKLIKNSGIDGHTIQAIGISYQMHGLVLIDADGKTLRPSIIWCDSRAVNIGDQAEKALGNPWCLDHLLNSPGNFTASKLKWVIDHEPAIASRIHKFLLPGDFINFKLSGETNTTVSALSEGMFWDYKNKKTASELYQYYSIPETWTPAIVNTFGEQGSVSDKVAAELGLKSGTKISYRAGDQPNNAFSLNVLEPGEIAATAGTSGVIYGIQDHLGSDPQSRVNAFAHVNHQPDTLRLGILLCVNGTGIANSWLRKLLGHQMPIHYESLNLLANESPIGSNGVLFYPFGNGSERMLGNKQIQSHLQNINFNHHQVSDVVRAVQEGIVFALNYGLEILKSNGLRPSKIKAGKANMFLSPVFRSSFCSLTETPLEFYDTDGATGAARGAGVGIGLYSLRDAFQTLSKLEEILPNPGDRDQLRSKYNEWFDHLQKIINQ